MTNEEMLAALLERNSALFTTYGAWAAAQTKLLAGAIDDPDSFNAEGGKAGALGYYPVENVNGQTIYVPSLARLQAMAAGGDLSAIEAVLTATVAAKDQAVEAKQQIEGSAALIDTALQPGVSAGALAEFDVDPGLSLSAGNLGKLLMAMVDQAGFLGAGIAENGTWAASRLRALMEVITPLVSAGSVNATGSVAAPEIKSPLLSLLSGGGLSIDDSGSLRRKQGGARLDVLDANFPLSITDEAGNIFAGLKDGSIYGPGSVTSRRKSEFVNSLRTVYFNGVEIELGAHNYDVAICDPKGNVLLGWMNGAFYSGGTSSLDSMLDTQDRQNKQFTQTLHGTRVTTVQRPTADLNLQHVHGQSLAQADETWPALSRTNRFGNLMLGNSVQPLNGGSVFNPVGGVSALNPLYAITIDGNNTLYPDETTTQASGGARGEPINHGWANGSRFALSQHLMDEDYTKRRFVSINVAVSGATIGELQKNHTEGNFESYGRYTDSINKVKAIATSTSKTMVVSAIGWLQGEHDYLQASGHNSLNGTYLKYRAKFEGMISDMQSDARTLTGQSLPPPFFSYQTGASFTRDVDFDGLPGMHVGMAQLDAVLASTTAWMVGPVYPYPDKGGHLDSNGSRWFGHQFAKVYEHVIIKGKDWEPLRPLRIWKQGPNTIFVGYHVPVAPLIFDKPQLAGGAEYDSATRGFRVTNDAGPLAVSEVTIIRDTIIRITCSAALGANPKLWYASQGTTGNGMVRDSDPTVAIDNYVYEPTRGMLTTANILKFVGKPYPLWNWGVGFCLPVEV